MRDDLKLREYAKENGFTESFNIRDKEAGRTGNTRVDCPHFTIQFVKDNTDVWFCKAGWAVKRRDASHYQLPTYFPTLKEALDSVK